MLGHQLVAVSNPIGSENFDTFFFSRTESPNRGSKITFGGEGGLGRRELVDFLLIFIAGFKVIRG